MDPKTTAGTNEVYVPRAVTPLGTWTMPPLSLKVYGLAADGQNITQNIIKLGQSFVNEDVLGCVNDTGSCNDLGFVIIHPGSLGLSISVHWWIQGSVLCQRFYRKLYDADAPLDMASRPSIGCVWELGIIHSEQDIWKRTMMTNAPNKQAYITQFAEAVTH